MQAGLDKLRAGTKPDQIAAAQAQVASAQANLDKLRGGQRSGSLAAGQAAVDVAQANLDKLRAGPSVSRLAVAEAQVQSAQAALDLAQAELQAADLRAPFAGVIAAINARSGEYAAPNVALIQLADTTTMQIETTDLTELKVVHVHIGASATITFDALPGLSVPGTVSQIESYGENKQGDIVYTVIIALNTQDSRLRWNMTTSVHIAPS